MDQINVTIDGKALTANAGDTILTIAAANGIEIPNLCYNKNLKIYGACGLCVVEAEGIPKLLRACATVASDGMVIHTDTPRVLETRKVALELIMSDHTGDCKGPCSLGCPAGTDVQGYVKQIGLGNYSDAIGIVKDHIPLPASIGRVCPHPCETECRRGLVEEPLSIAFLKAYAADQDMASAHRFAPQMAAKTGKNVAIIGGGPAGLSAAYYLAIAGHSVTIYDAMPKMGGMLRYGIPEYRLPKAVLDDEVAFIQNMGVEMKNNVKVGDAMTLEGLRKQSDAVIVAIGAWKSSGVRCPGEDMEGVLGGIDFLCDVAQGKAPDIGDRVAIVGGGNTAMDACRTAVRLGAKDVYVVYRRTRAEAPAEEIEITEAIEEGVQFKFLTNPAEILGENGHVKQMKLQIMELGEPDESGRRRPVPVEGKFEMLDLDTVIAAIGQKVDPAGIEGVDLNKWGIIAADEDSYLTNLDGVFAIGDATNKGASIAVEAIGEAGRAAACVNQYLAGATPRFVKPFVSKKVVTAEDLADRPKQPRAVMPVKPAQERRGNFEEVIEGFSEDQVQKEAQRCLECGCFDYHDCRLIKYANLMPIDPDRFGGSKHDAFKEDRLVAIERDMGKCILCGLCVRTCDEEVGKGLLGLVGRGFNTVVKPEFQDPQWIAGCRDCHKCVDYCPTGALKLL